MAFLAWEQTDLETPVDAEVRSEAEQLALELFGVSPALFVENQGQ